MATLLPPEALTDPVSFRLRKVFSGGQTGVDRAGLDAALAAGIPIGGWCPHGRKAEDGSIPARYPLVETGSAGYRQRTEWNVRDTDATLILARGQLRGGTLLTKVLAARHDKPCLIIDLPANAPEIEQARAWIESEPIHILNVAGPRESQCPGINALATAFLRLVFAR